MNDGGQPDAEDTTTAGADAEPSMSDGDGEPGFGDTAEGGDALPDMTDTLPTLQDSYGDSDEIANSSQGNDSGNAPRGEGDMPGNGGYADGQGAQNTGAADAGSDGYGTASPGTRASGGLEGIAGTNGTLTSAEQVAILDRQLEQSTSDFDGMIREEQERQRELERERAARSAQREQPESAGPGASGRNPYQDDVAMGGSGASGGGGGIGGASGNATGIGKPDNRATHKPPADIPNGNDDDVVARQLREAAMREPDPEVRKKLWDEYRKYKGLEIPEE